MNRRLIKFISRFLVGIIVFISLCIPQTDVCARGLDTDAKARNISTNSIILYLGSSKAFVNDMKVSIDKDNPDIQPVVKNSTTLVPIRFISESLGAKVDWDGKTSTVTITFNNKIIKLVLNSKKMLVNGYENELTVPAEASEGRIFIPLRAVSQAFGKKVFYDRKLIVISGVENIINPATEEELVDLLISRFNHDMLPEMSVKQISAAYDKSVVVVLSYYNSKKPIAQGSGFCVGDGLFLTNYHVLDGGNWYEVISSSGQKYEVEGIVKYDDVKDLAIIKLKYKADIPSLKIGSKSMLEKADKVVAIGSPEGLQNTISDGIVSGFRKDEDDLDLIQITVPIAHGSSGGPLFNMKGYVVGVNTSGFEGGGNLNFAVAVDYAKPWIDELKTKSFDNILVLRNINQNIEEEVIACMNKQIQAMRDEDIDSYMETIDENHPSYSHTRQNTEIMFQQFDIEYTVKELTVIEKSGSRAKVRLTLVANIIKGPKAQSNESTSVHTLKKINGKWKVTGSVCEKLIYLD